jgi:hypothetical protein
MVPMIPRAGTIAVVLALQLAALVPLTILLGFGPGFFVVRRFRWHPIETLAASVGLSLTMVFVASFTAFWLDLPDWVDVLVTATAGALTLAAWRDGRRLWRHRIVRHSVVALAGLAVWTLLLLSLIRQYGGGDWCCDWLEHFQRTQHFITPWPRDFLYIDRYLFAARPPLMNAVAAQLLAHIDPTLPAFQVVLSLLNVLVLLSCTLVSRVVSPNGRSADPRVMAVLLGANPMFFMNATFAWTKVLAAFFVLLALALYVVGWRRHDGRRVAAAFVALAAATLTHYSAAPAAVLVGLHFLLTGQMRDRAAAFVLLPAILLVGLWVGYVTMTYGVEAGLVRNPSLEGTAPRTALEHLQTRALNLLDTIVPRPYAGYLGYPKDATLVRRASDQVFTLYQSNAVAAIGMVNGVMAIVLAWSALRRARWRSVRSFWVMFVSLLVVTGVVVHGDRAESGLAMISLQPLTYLALAFLATRLRGLPLWARRLWMAGTLVDVTLGVALAVWFEMATGSWARTPNWALKADAGVQFLGDRVTVPALPILALVVGAILAGRFAAAGMRLGGDVEAR